MHNVEWKPELSVGIENIDDDHKRLIELTNTLIGAIDKETPKEALLEIFEELEAYTHYHFSHEEGFMDENCTNNEVREMIQKHKAQHRYFIDRLPELKERLIQTTSKSVSYEVVEFLLHWLLDHIINEDLKLSQCLHEKPSSKRPLLQRISDALAEKTTIHQRLWIIFALPLTFFIIQTLFISYNGYQKYDELKKIQQITQTAVNINNVITQLQKERGLSSAYIASGYRHFKDKLDTQRSKTDQIIAYSLPAKKYIDPYTNTEECLQALQKLKKIRYMINTKKIKQGKSAAYYSHFIQVLIDTIKYISYLPFNGVDQNTFTPLLLLLNINEIQGQIRNEGIVSIEHAEASHEQLKKLLQQRESYLNTFKLLAPANLTNTITQIENEKEAKDIAQMQKDILENKLHGSDMAQKWFGRTTSHIDKYKDLIEISLQKMAHSAAYQKNHFSSLIFTIWSVFAAITLFIGLSILLMKESILQPLKVLTRALHNLSSGDKRFYFRQLNKKDAIGKMEQAYNHLRRTLIKADYANILMELQEMKTQKYEKLAEEDPLTGIYNRRAFMKRIREALYRAKKNHHSLALLILDLDYFKQVNDTYGHEIGDMLLKYFAAHVRTLIRNHDIFARIGGEEFALLLPDTSPEEARSLAEKIVNEIFLLDLTDLAPELRISVSIGVAVLQDDMTLQQLFKTADTHMYEAKRNGRNCTYG
jgi:diguanylate cyclase (GGDEF)-like protein/hemerythrin-like metal-binding protein